MHGIFTYIWLLWMVNVGNHTSAMDAMGYGSMTTIPNIIFYNRRSATFFFQRVWFFRLKPTLSCRFLEERRSKPSRQGGSPPPNKNMPGDFKKTRVCPRKTGEPVFFQNFWQEIFPNL